MSRRNKNTSLKEKSSLKQEKRTCNGSLKHRSQQQLGWTKPFSPSKSSPNLITANMESVFNICNGGVVRVQLSLDTANVNPVYKFLHYPRSAKTWETHHLSLCEDAIISGTPTGIFSSPLKYTSISHIVGVELKQEFNVYWVKICTASTSVYLHVSNRHQRERWLHSIQWKINVWKSKTFLTNTTQPDALLQEIKNLVKLTVDSLLDVDDTYHILLDIVSELLVQKSDLLSNISGEAFVAALAPLLERNQPSYEICNFFTKHCRLCPRSAVVMEMFTPIVQRILKHNMDFGKYSWLRTFALEYIQALSSQNNGVEQVKKFVHLMHGPMRQCPHPRVLSNLVAVCLAAIYQCFTPEELTNNQNGIKKSKLVPGTICENSDKDPTGNYSHDVNSLKNVNCEIQNLGQQFKTVNEDLKFQNPDLTKKGNPNLVDTYARTEKRLSVFDLNQHTELSDTELETLTLFVGILMEISKFSDWCPGLASLLQPLPFPDGALTNVRFTRLMYPIIEQFAEDGRDVVVKSLICSRDNQDDWLQVFSPGASACEDDGKLYSKMMESVFTTGSQIGRLRKLLSRLAVAHLEVIIMLAVRENKVMIQVLSDMLKMAVLVDEQEQLQAMTALRCTATGKEVYNELKEVYSTLNQKGGLLEYYPPPNFTDDDLEKLFSTGVWGNLEVLDLSYTKVSSRSAAILANLPNLKHLNLCSTRFDGNGLRVLCDSLDLRNLNLCETNVGDDAIQCLEAMQNLEYLNLNSTRLQTSTFYSLKQALPNLVGYDITYTDADTGI